MGDLALCREWIADLGREEFEFAFVLDRSLTSFIDSRDRCFSFAADIHVEETILRAAATVSADVIIFASNAFWNLGGQKGAEFGRFPLGVHRAGVPVLSFDPFEIAFDNVVPRLGKRTHFEPVPESVWALRYMSRSSERPLARHFYASRIWEAACRTSRAATISGVGGDPGKKTVIFPISKNRFDFITKFYGDYYPHLGRILAHSAPDRVQFIIVSPEPVPGLTETGNVIHVPFLPFDDFLALIHASDAYLADSMISCINHAIRMATPALLLANTRTGEATRGSFLEHGAFAYKVFPYGLYEACDILEHRFEISDCYLQAEALDVTAAAEALDSLLYSGALRSELIQQCHHWRANREALPTPRQTIDDILSMGVAIDAMVGAQGKGHLDSVFK